MIKYKKITSNADIWDFKNNEILEGKYTGLKEGVGKNNSILYYIEKDGAEFAFLPGTPKIGHLVCSRCILNKNKTYAKRISIVDCRAEAGNYVAC